MSIHATQKARLLITNNAAMERGGLRLYDSAWMSNCVMVRNTATNWAVVPLSWAVPASKRV